jgi:hypothetical protein
MLLVFSGSINRNDILFRYLQVVLVGCMSGWLCFDYLEYFLSVNKFSAVAMLFWPRLQLSQVIPSVSV